MSVLLGGILPVLSLALAAGGTTSWTARLAAGAAVAALALYGMLQAVDGVALKQTVDAWAAASDAEKAMRFASAESIRWLEWGVRSYQDFAVGLALLLAAAATRPSGLPRGVGYLIGLAALAFLAQGWLVGSQGFSGAETIAILLGFVLNLAWMAWLLVVASPSRGNGQAAAVERSGGRALDHRSSRA